MYYHRYCMYLDYVLAMDLDRLLPEVRQIRRVTLTCASVQYSIVTFFAICTH
jgi:hypothetical protein